MSSRSYLVGLPVSIEVHADGSITFEVHLEEADDLFDDAPTDDNLRPLYSDAEIEADQQVVSAAAATINRTFSVTTNPPA